MEVVGNITRSYAGGAAPRPAGTGAIAPTVRSGNDGARSPRDDSQTTSEKHDKVVQAGHVVAAKAKAKAKVEQQQEQPEAVTIDPMFDRRVGSGREGRIGVQKQHRVSAGMSHAGIELCRAAARCSNQLVDMFGRALPRGIGAAAIDHDQLVAARAKRLQRDQRRLDA